LPVLFDRYQILGIIGEGGMGIVFKGYHLNLKRHVAIKTLRFDRSQTDDMVSRFVKEMEAVGQMDHPNVVRATDAGEKNQVCYLVMDYLTGSDLSCLTKRHGRLSIADACGLICQAGAGLEYIHQTRVHRDIKPSNLMLTTTGQVKILDLGLARFGVKESVGADVTPLGQVMGTYAYMAPEQALSGVAVDCRADIYSLGCTLYKLLTGDVPFSGPEYSSVAAVVYAHCHVPLASVPTFALVPESMRDVLLKMMAKDPGERFQTAREVIEALTPFSESSALAPPGLLDRVKREVETTPVTPLPDPLPMELSRLMDHASETSQLTPMSSQAVAPIERRRWPRWLVGLCVAACVVAAALIWFFPVGPFGQKPADLPPVVRAELRDLDDLVPHKNHGLLDLPLLPIGFSAENPSKWRWDKSETIDARGADYLFFPMGTTSRSHFTFEVGITQAPWTGNVGIFWGYRENPELKKSKAPLQEFAWFQMLRIYQEPGHPNGVKDYVQRGRGTLRYNSRGEIAYTFVPLDDDVVVLRTGEVILRIEIDANRLKGARLGAQPLPTVYSDLANNRYQADPYQGSIGFFALKHAATFSNVRFMMHSRN
jgi:serine/threonine protein kinase